MHPKKKEKSELSPESAAGLTDLLYPVKKASLKSLDEVEESL
jgi:hypothetical protein